MVVLLMLGGNCKSQDSVGEISTGIWVGTWSEKWSVWQENDPQNDTIFSRLYPGIYISGACASSEPCHEFYIKSRSGESLGAERRRKVMPKK